MRFFTLLLMLGLATTAKAEKQIINCIEQVDFGAFGIQLTIEDVPNDIFFEGVVDGYIHADDGMLHAPIAAPVKVEIHNFHNRVGKGSSYVVNHFALGLLTIQATPLSGGKNLFGGTLGSENASTVKCEYGKDEQ